MSHFKHWHLQKKILPTRKCSCYSFVLFHTASMTFSYLFMEMLPVSWFVLFNSKSHSHSSLSHKNIFILPHHSHHGTEGNSFNQTPPRAYSCFECHLKAILSSWITVEIPMISGQADTVLTRLRPRNELGVWQRSAIRLTLPPSFQLSQKKPEGGCGWKKKRKNKNQHRMLQK